VFTLPPRPHDDPTSNTTTQPPILSGLGAGVCVHTLTSSTRRPYITHYNSASYPQWAGGRVCSHSHLVHTSTLHHTLYNSASYPQRAGGGRVCSLSPCPHVDPTSHTLQLSLLSSVGWGFDHSLTSSTRRPYTPATHHHSMHLCTLSTQGSAASQTLLQHAFSTDSYTGGSQKSEATNSWP